MKIQCPSCNFSAEVPEERIPNGGTTATCPTCKTKFNISKGSDFLFSPEPASPQMRCPKCGEGQSVSNTCIKCGLIFSKFISEQTADAKAGSPVEQKSSASDTKPCPLCGEEILFAAIKCKHCKSMLTDDNATTATKASRIDESIILQKYLCLKYEKRNQKDSGTYLGKNADLLSAHLKDLLFTNKIKIDAGIELDFYLIVDRDKITISTDSNDDFDKYQVLLLMACEVGFALNFVRLYQRKDNHDKILVQRVRKKIGYNVRIIQQLSKSSPIGTELYCPECTGPFYFVNYKPISSKCEYCGYIFDNSLSEAIKKGNFFFGYKFPLKYTIRGINQK